MNEGEVQMSDFARREEELLARWGELSIFAKQLDATRSGNPFTYYDGPPFATGLPHFGHLLPTGLKDAVPRYQAMRGNFVARQWGWDCHGLPIENLIQKELSLPSKADIEVYGVEKFSEAASASVDRFDAEWKKVIPRAGRWVDMDAPYRTMDPNFTESGWWAFKSLFEKGLVYEGFTVMHVSPLLETGLSNMESAQNYKEITDVSAYVAFPIVESAALGLPEGAAFVAWTTTPWTLPGNVALALNPELSYVLMRREAKGVAGEEGYVAAAAYVVAASRAQRMSELVAGLVVDETWSKTGTELAGVYYVAPFDAYASDAALENRENGWKTYCADFVTDDSGTGIVHIACAFGQDDLELGKREKLPFVQHVRIDGSIKPEVTALAGMQAKPKDDPTKTDIEVIKILARAGRLVAKEKIVHSYPHCPRTDAPLLNYAMGSWFIAVSKYRERMVELNRGVRWVPEEIGEGRFGKWIESARDWSVSRARYWGAPIPIWRSEDGSVVEVIGSLAELQSKTKSTNRWWQMRHAQSQGNLVDAVSATPRDSDGLTDEGRVQAKASAETLRAAGITRIFCSDMTRALETAEIVRETLGLPTDAVVVDERLREFGAGDFNGKKWSEFHAFFAQLPTSKRYTTRIPGGESYADVKRRATEFLFSKDAELSGENVLVVSHGAPLSMMRIAAQATQENRVFAAYRPADHALENPNSFGNAEVKELGFAPYPVNAKFELDMHRPYVDSLSWMTDGKVMCRVPEVFDTWYDSGSVPFAKFHYPFENKEAFDAGVAAAQAGKQGAGFFPADFIAEGQDQTRGWFYSMLALNTPLFDASPYRNVVVNGMVLAEDGQKMSKSKGNFPPPLETIAKYSSDALRLFLLGSPVVKAEDVRFSERGVDEVQKKVIGRLRNVVTFFETYADEVALSNVVPASANRLDRWIVARLAETRDEIERSMEEYRIDRAVRPFGIFVDDLSTWYLRRSRERMKDDADETDRAAAVATTRFVLVEFSKLLAPFAPYLADDVYLRVVGSAGKESVHLESWPTKEAYADDVAVRSAMDQARTLVTAGLEARVRAKAKVRQPLAKVTANEKAYPALADAALAEIVRDELNVKALELSATVEDVELDTVITDDLRREGLARDLIRAIQSARKDSGLSPVDRAAVLVNVSDELWADLAQSLSVVRDATRADSLDRSTETLAHEASVGDVTISTSVTRSDVSRS
jgi:isoleucyl-tRNA synthetase